MMRPASRPGLLSHCLLYPLFLWLSGCEGANGPPAEATSPTVFFHAGQAKMPSAAILGKIDEMKGFARIEPGAFEMGSLPDEIGRKSDEDRHRTSLSHPFWMKKFEVTNDEWNEGVSEDLRKGLPVYELSGKALEAICSKRRLAEGNYTVASYEREAGKVILLKEARRTQQSWARPNTFLTLEADSAKFGELDKLMEYFSSLGIENKGRLDGNLPVTHVSYSQAVAFCWKKTEQAHAQGIIPKDMVCRLPTEAEWEYACRAGYSGPSGMDDGLHLSGENANLNGSRREYVIDERQRSSFSLGEGSFTPRNRKSVSEINPSAPRYPANRWGIHDMHGNVKEWCHDFYGPYSKEETVVDPIGPIRGTKRVVRGGSFIRTAFECRSAHRFSYEPSYRGSEIGFRYVIGLPLR